MIMPREWPTSPLELKVMKIIKNHLMTVLGNFENIVDGGIYFKYKPKNIRVKVIEINITDHSNSTSISSIKQCFVNINYQDENQDLVEEVTEYIFRIIDHTVIRNLFFESRRKEIRKISPYLWLGNNYYEITNNSIYKKVKHHDRIE